MLQEFRIRDLGVIDDAVVEPHPGLTVLTGETGAGKTMVVTGLGLLLGARGDAGLVRPGASRAVVEGVLALPDGHPALALAADAGGDVQDGLVLARSVSLEGRSRAHVGGRSAPVGVLAEIGEQLVAVHGQADQWRLRRPEQHRDLLDAFAGPDVLALRAEHERVWDELRAVRDEADALDGDAAARIREADALRFGLEQIDRVRPEPGEVERLRAESERLGHAADLRAAAEEAVRALAGDDSVVDAAPSALELLGRVRHTLKGTAAHDPQLAALSDRATDIGHVLGELVSDLAAYAAGVEVDPARLEAVEARRGALAELVRRYGPTLEDVFVWDRQAALRVVELDGGDDRLELLRSRASELAADVAALAERLSAERVAAAARLAGAVTAELGHLAMGKAVVDVAVTRRAVPGRVGADDVDILLSANPGSAPASITRAASGGELSRLMLALELVAEVGDGDAAPTFVFDEVDAGIGGAAALSVGSRLAALARHAQVIVVTHLAQVAAYADRHLVVTKASDGDGTRTVVAEVTGAEREAALARMMSGQDTPRARQHARELLVAARADRGAGRVRKVGGAPVVGG